MMAAAARVAVAEVAVVRANPPLVSGLPARAPSQLAPPRRDATVAAVHAAPRIGAVNRIAASPRPVDLPIADHPPPTAMLARRNEHNFNPHPSPRAVAIAANVAA